jgi:endosialidase-like protein
MMQRTLVASLITLACQGIGHEAFAQNCDNNTSCISTIQSGNGNAISANGSGSGYTIYAQSTNTAAFYGQANSDGAYGVYGVNSLGGVAVFATTLGASGGIAIQGVTASGTSTSLLGNAQSTGVGVQGTTVDGYGVWGVAQTGRGGQFESTSSYGVFAGSHSGIGGFFTSGVLGNGGPSDVGVEGWSAYNNGVMGVANVSGVSGVYGVNNSGQGYGVAGRITPSGAGNAIYGDNWSSSGWAGNFNGRVWVGYGLDVNGTCVSGNCSSDERLKKNVKPLVGSLDAVAALRPVTFEWKTPRPLDRPAGTQTGFIAQEVEKVEPTWVQTDADGFKTINRDALPMLLVDSIKTLKAQNDELRERVASLEAARRPVSQNLGLMGGLGLLVVGGAFATFRRARKQGEPT